MTTDRVSAPPGRGPATAARDIRPAIARWCLSIALAWAILEGYHRIGLRGDEAALGADNRSVAATVAGVRVNSWQADEFDAVWGGPAGAAAADRGHPAALILGNSQLFSVNQPAPDDEPVPEVASELAGYPVIGLSLPNANLQEHLLVFAWALARRRPDVVALGVFYDDLREDGIRPGLDVLDSPRCRELLGRSASGRAVVADVEKRIAERETSRTDLQGTTTASQSLQERAESFLEGWLRDRSYLWRDRDDMMAALQVKHLRALRNWAFGIDARTVRPMISSRYEKNMAAIDAIMQLARDEGVCLLVYVPPLRDDVAPPYDAKAYAAWQAELAAACGRRGVEFADFGPLVPAEHWGSRGGTIDFMHFRGAGHRLLATALAERLGLGAGKESPCSSTR
jgi:hypothetical protein